MWIEQLDNEHRSREKQEKKESREAQDFFESQKLKAETSNLLQSLASQIAQEFWIDISEVKNLISSSTSGNLDQLKSSFSNNETINISDLSSAISAAKEKIEQLSKHQINSLKNSLDAQKYCPEDHEYITSKKILPDNLLQKAYNPQNFWDQIIWVWVGVFDSTEAVILFTYALGKWIILTPYHIYLLLTGKWEYDWFKNI